MVLCTHECPIEVWEHLEVRTILCAREYRRSLAHRVQKARKCPIGQNRQNLQNLSNHRILSNHGTFVKSPYFVKTPYFGSPSPKCPKTSKKTRITKTSKKTREAPESPRARDPVKLERICAPKRVPRKSGNIWKLEHLVHSKMLAAPWAPMTSNCLRWASYVHCRHNASIRIQYPHSKPKLSTLRNWH